MNLKAELEKLTPSVEPSRWRGHEHVRGYGVFGLPLSSGHTLALRVFPINDFRGTSSLEFVEYSIGNWQCKCGNLKGLNYLRANCTECGKTIVNSPYNPESGSCKHCGARNEIDNPRCEFCGSTCRKLGTALASRLRRHASNSFCGWKFAGSFGTTAATTSFSPGARGASSRAFVSFEPGAGPRCEGGARSVPGLVGGGWLRSIPRRSGSGRRGWERDSAPTRR